MTIPGMGIYSSVAIMLEIDNISRFSSKEKLASYAVSTAKDHDTTIDLSKRGIVVYRD